MRFIPLLFVLFSALHLGLALNLPNVISENNFPYRDILYKYFRFYPLTPFANFDGYQYISIAKIGYQELQQSYFPLFPGLIFLAAQVFKNYIISGVIVTWVFFFLGLVYFYKLAGLLLKDNAQAQWALLFLASFPTAFYFQVIYTESLFLFESSAAFYYLYRKKYFWAAVFAIFASLTKVQGALLVIPFALVLFEFGKPSLHGMLHFIKTKYYLILIALSPLYGLLAYMGYLFVQTKDPLYFYHAQSAFGAERAVDKIILLPQVLYRYIKIFLTSDRNFTYWISVLEFVICVAFVGIIAYELFRLIKQKKKDMQHIALQSYSLVILLLPTLTGTLTSLPRYALLSFGFFIILARIHHTFSKVLLVFFFLLVHVILFLFFLKGYFIS